MSSLPNQLDVTSRADLADVRVLLTDFEETLTNGGRIASATLTALERLERCGIAVIVATRRAAGWCEMMARVLPVHGVISENGYVSFRYDRASQTMRREYM